MEYYLTCEVSLLESSEQSLKAPQKTTAMWPEGHGLTTCR